MDNQIKLFLELFSNDGSSHINFTESWDSVDITAAIILDKIPDANSVLTHIPSISDRDSWELKILDENDETILTIHSAFGEINNFNEIDVYRELPISIKFIITKNIQDSKLSIYSILLY